MSEIVAALLAVGGFIGYVKARLNDLTEEVATLTRAVEEQGKTIARLEVYFLGEDDR